MKIGILTFHNAHNYGAVLQAYALRTVLRRMGHDAVILNYRNKAIQEHYPEKLCTGDIKKQADWHKQYQRFETFIEQILLEGETDVLQREDLECMDIDCFVCGSDQIWEAGLTGGLDPVYFLNFKCNAKKISYAASRMLSAISEKEVNYFRNNLSKFAGVSVREMKIAEELNKIGIIASSVLDPTLLLNAEDYDFLIDKDNYERREYVLAYYVMEDKMLEQCAGEAAKMFGISLKEIHFFRLDGFTTSQMADCGPREFISLFKNAKYVFTNSYHGVIFSVLFQKAFYAVYQKDSRKDDLLQKIDLEDRHITNAGEIILDEVDFAKAYGLLDKEKEGSVKFLEQLL